MASVEMIEKVKKAIDEYSSEGSIKRACERQGVSLRSFYTIRLEVPLVSSRYDSARKLRADVLADEVTEIADNDPNPHRARIRCDARRWACGVFNRQVYGDKVDMTIDGRVDLTVALSEARTRALRLTRDSEVIEDSQAIEIPNLPDPGATDTESVDPPDAPDSVDIFE